MIGFGRVPVFARMAAGLRAFVAGCWLRVLVTTVLAVGVVAYAGAVSPRQLVEVADLGFPVVSPDGTYVAFRLEQPSIERNTHDSVWYVQRLDGTSPPLRVAEGGVILRDSGAQPLSPSAIWSPDGQWLYFLALAEGRVEVWRAAADGSGAMAVTRDAADVRGFALERDGRVLAYRVGATREQVRRAEQEEYDRGIRIDASTPVGQNLYRSGRLGGVPATQKLGNIWFERVPLLAEVSDQWKAIDPETGNAVQAVSRSASEAVDKVQLSAKLPEPWKIEKQADSGRIALLTRVGDSAVYLNRPDVQLSVLAGAGSRAPTICSSPLCTGRAITRVQWRPDSDELLYVVTDSEVGHAQSIYRWNVVKGEVHSVARSAGLLSGGRDRDSQCGLSRDALVCVAADAARPPYLVRIDITTGEQRVLFEPNAALARAIAGVDAVRLLRWQDEAGRSFSGQFYPARPTPAGGAPLFVTYYVCPGFVRGGLGDEWPLLSLAARGVAALCINAAPYHLDAAVRYGVGFSAIEAAVRLLAAEGEVDRTRVGMGGLSFGTEVTLWTMMHADLLTAASISSPALSRQYYLLGSLRGETFFSGLQKLWQAGAPDATPGRWQQLSPALNLEAMMRTPLLMQVPEQEFIHTLDYSIPLMREQRADVYVFPDEPHLKFQPRHMLAAYERNLDWFLFWLQNYEDPAPAKVSQYVQWRSMRTRVSEE